jgi:hypothetical protein
METLNTPDVNRRSSMACSSDRQPTREGADAQKPMFKAGLAR